jgi:hypothetical protein
MKSLRCIRALRARGTASVPHAATNMETRTHSIYTIFLPDHNAVHMETFSQALGSLAGGRVV